MAPERPHRRATDASREYLPVEGGRPLLLLIAGGRTWSFTGAVTSWNDYCAC